LSVNKDDKTAELLKEAENAARSGNHEKAARFLRRLAAYKGLIRDMTNFRRFMADAGDLYERAAEDVWNNKNKLEAVLLYLKASKCYRDAGEDDKADKCDNKIYTYYLKIKDANLSSFEGSAQDLKLLGDFLKGRGDLEAAGDCYRWAAEKAAKEGKLALSGGLYRDAGDCSWSLGKSARTAQEYSKAAQNYLVAKEYFEAAWHYNLSGFLYILAGKFKEASEMARMAGIACLEGKIPVILDRMSRLCSYLSRGYIHDAEKEWSILRRKMKIDYAQLIERCFRKVRAALKEKYPSKY